MGGGGGERGSGMGEWDGGVGWGSWAMVRFVENIGEHGF